MIETKEIEVRPVFNRISPREVLLGANIPAIDRLKLMDEDQFEDFVYEWAFGFLKEKYPNGIKRLGGAGDKGRDVVGYKEGNRLDVYQCKHYSTQITPSGFSVEVGKLIYYTYKNHLRYPDNYFIVSTLGLGPKLHDQLHNNLFKEFILSNWGKYCEHNITSKFSVPLDDGLKKYIESLDFSVIRSIEPLELIAQHKKTKFHAVRFGGGLQTTRKIIVKADAKIQPRELKYINCLKEVYEEEVGSKMLDCSELESINRDLFNHYNNQRDSFYSAESLERFSRDNFPTSNPLPFDELKEESSGVMLNGMIRLRKENGLDRMTNIIHDIEQQTFPSNGLRDEITVLDKSGLCHHLINDGRFFSWYHTSKPG